MFIKQAHSLKNKPLYYILGTIIVFLFWQGIGVLPLMGALILAVVFKHETTKDILANIPVSITDMVGLLGSNLFLFLMILSFAFGLVALFFWNKKYHGNSIKSLTTTRKKIDMKRVLFAFMLIGVVNLAFFGVDYMLAPEKYIWNFNPSSFFTLLLMSFLLLPIQTSFEEYFFRGYLLQGIGLYTKNRWMPLVITSVLFGLLHIFNPEVAAFGMGIMVFYIGTGLFLGITTLMDEGLELALGFHAANNIIAAVLVTSNWSALQTAALFKDVSPVDVSTTAILPVLLYPILLFIFAKKYQWHSWRQKLTAKIILPEDC